MLHFHLDFRLPLLKYHQKHPKIFSSLVLIHTLIQYGITHNIFGENKKGLKLLLFLVFSNQLVSDSASRFENRSDDILAL